MGSLWFLVAIATGACGGLMVSLAAPASAAAGLGTALSGTVLAVSLALAVRIVAALERARNRPSFAEAWKDFRTRGRR